MLDLGAALLDRDYNRDVRGASQHAQAKGASQDIWSQVGGYSAQGLLTLLLSSTLGPAGMAIAGGLANAAGRYAGGTIAGAQHGDYKGQFALDTAQELESNLSDSLFIDSLIGGASGGIGSFKAGIGAGKEAVGKVSEEAVQSKLADTMANINIKDLSLEHGILGTDPTTWDTVISAELADGTREELGSTLKATLLRGDKLPDKFNDASFIANVNGTSIDFDMYKESLDLLELGQSAGVGREYLDNYLQAESLKNVGLDPYSIVGQHPSGAPMSLVDAEFSGLDLEGRLDYLKNAYSTTAEQGIRENAAFYGLDFNDQGIADYLVSDPSELGVETWGKKWQDIQTMGGLFGGGFEKSGGMEGLFGEGFGLHFQDPSDTMPVYDPATNTWTTPTSKNFNPWGWVQDNPWKSALGGAGLLTLLGTQGI
tara:strand:- start:3082 stop:4359 length:1278 start_codon:yes stop_codon:yes gene_type:complete